MPGALALLLLLGTTACAAQRHAASTPTTQPTPAATSTPTAGSTGLSNQQIADIKASFQQVEPGHTFSADVQQSGELITFYDVTSGGSQAIAIWGPSTGSVTAQSGQQTTPPTFRFETDEGAAIAVRLLQTKQNAEVAAGSDVISVICPVALPSGATYSAKWQIVGVGHAPFDKHPALIVTITFPHDGAARLINPYTVDALPAPDNNFFPDGVQPAVTFGIAGLGPDQTGFQALVYTVANPTGFQNANVDKNGKALPGTLAGTFTVSSGERVNAEVVGIGTTTPMLFTIDGGEVTFG